MTPTCNALFVTVVGSQLYGFATEKSDIDFKGFCLPSIPQLIGLDSFEQQEYNNEKPDGPEKMEGTIYALARYLHLGIIKCNPTVLEIAFTEPKYWMYKTDLGLEVCQFIKNHGITKRLFKPYNAYHLAQMKKMSNTEKTGKRKELIDEFRYDVKNASHAFRLGRQATLAMQTGKIIPTLTGNDLILGKDIRSGKYCLEEVMEILRKIDKEMYEAYKTSTIKEEPDYHLVNDFLVDIHQKYVKNELPEIKPWKPW